GSFLIGVLLFALDTYVPLFVQGVRGGTAARAGRTITPLFLAWSISVAVAAAVVVRFGFRRTAAFGSVLIASGVLALVLGAQRPETHALLAPGQLYAVQVALGRSLRDAFLEMFVLALLAILCAIGLPGGVAGAGKGRARPVGEEEGLALAVGAEH